MAKFLALSFLICAGIGVSLGNYWFTYGLWPKSWVSFVGWGLAGILLFGARLTLDKEGV